MPQRAQRPHDEPAIDAAHIITRLAIALLLIGVPIASVVTIRAVYALVPVGAALSLAAWLLAPGERGPHELRNALFSRIGLAALLLVAWTGLSLIWTPFGTGPSERFVKTLATCALVAAAAVLLPERTRTSNLYLLPIGVAVASIAVIALSVFGGAQRPATQFSEFSLMQRANFGLALLAWPAMGALALREKTRSAAALAGLTVAALLAAQTPLALAASACGALAFAAALADKHKAALGVALFGALAFLLAPLFCIGVWGLFSQSGPPSFLAPAFLWGQFLSLEDIHALTGHGFDSARLGKDAAFLPAATPRSMLFEIWFELGLVGAVVSAALMALTAYACSRARTRIAPFLLGGLVAAFVLCAFGVGISAVWWVTLLTLSGFAFALLRHGHARARRPAASKVWRDVA